MPWSYALLLISLFTRSEAPLADPVLIFDVSVIPMDVDTVMTHVDVLVERGRISRMSPHADPPQTSGRAIDGRGKFLVPGLSDMHVHLSTSAELPQFVAHGVLTVRDLNGSPETLAWRDSVRSGQLVGPRLFVSGPMLAGGAIPWRNKVTPNSAAEARAAVLAQKSAGYDQIKLYDGLSLEAFDAAIAAAKESGLLSSGHIPAAAGFDHVLSSGMDGLEHLDKTVFATVGHNLDTLTIDGIAQRVTASRMWVTPTIASMMELSLIGSGRFDSLMARPQNRTAPEVVRRFWSDVSARMKGSQTIPGAARYNPWTVFQMRLAKALNAAGVPLLVGTDLPNALLSAGAGVREELDALVASGLTRFDALRAATIRPAQFEGQLNDWGSIAVGKRANLVVLSGNPLIDFDVLEEPIGVILEGRWIDQDELSRMRGAIRK